MYIWLGREGYTHMGAGVLEGQKRAPAPPELELQAVVSCLTWMLRTTLGLSAGVGNTLSHLCKPWFVS